MDHKKQPLTVGKQGRTGSSLLSRYRAFPQPARASFWFLICLFLQRGISAITTPIFTRILSTVDYGVYGSYTSWMEIVTILVTLCIYSSVHIQGLVKFDGEQREFSSAMQGLLLSLCLFWLAVYFLFPAFFERLLSLNLLQITGMFVTIWAEGAFSLWANEQRVSYAYRALIVVTLIASVLKPALSILLIRLFPDAAPTARIWGYALAALVCYGWTAVYQISRGRKPVAWKWWKYALCYNIPLVPHYLSQVIMSSSDRIMIRAISGASEAGIYDLGNTLSNIMAIFNTAIFHTLTPWIMQKIREKKFTDITRVSDPSVILIALVNLCLIALAPEAVRVFAPPEYYYAIWVIPPIAMGLFFRFAYSLFVNFELYYDQQKKMALATVAGALLNIILNAWLIPIFGFLAAGYTTLISYASYAVMHFLIMNRIIRTETREQQPYNLRFLGIVTLLFLGVGFIFMISYLLPVLRLCLILISGTLLFVFRKRIRSLIQPFLPGQFTKESPSTDENK